VPPTEGNSWQSAVKTYAPLVGWIILIFFFSSGAASAAQTSRFIRPLLVFLFPSAPEETLRQYHFFIRKCAHFTEYAVLAFWATRALARSSYRSLRNSRHLLAVVIVLTVASLDEFNQSFEPSRTSTIWDVGLDLLGGTTMAISLKLLELWRRDRPRRTETIAG
jgi:VanZ family protein